MILSWIVGYDRQFRSTLTTYYLGRPQSLMASLVKLSSGSCIKPLYRNTNSSLGCCSASCLCSENAYKLYSGHSYIHRSLWYFKKQVAGFLRMKLVLLKLNNNVVDTVQKYSYFNNILGADETTNPCLLFFQTRINAMLHGYYLKSISDKITGKWDRYHSDYIIL